MARQFTTPIVLPGDPASSNQASNKNYVDSKVASVTAADSTVTVAGTATSPTVKVNAIAESQVTGLVTDLAAKVSLSLASVKGDLLASNASTLTRLPVGADGQLLTADSSQTVGMAWAVPAITGVASLTAANATITVGGTSSDPTVAVGTLAESNVTNLVSDLALKAPLASPTFTGTATFTRQITTPQTITWASSITPVATNGNNFQITATAATTINAPTSPTAGQLVLIEVLASGGSWAVTLSGITLSTGITAANTVASTKSGLWGLRYSGLLSAWVCIAYTASL